MAYLPCDTLILENDAAGLLTGPKPLDEVKQKEKKNTTRATRGTIVLMPLMTPLAQPRGRAARDKGSSMEDGVFIRLFGSHYSRTSINLLGSNLLF